MLTPDQARRLKEAGLSAYNHNLDTSREFYPEVITSRTYDERLATIEAVREAGISVCSGGILGLGEQDEDRVGLIHEVSRWVIIVRLWAVFGSDYRMGEHPESFPVNTLVPIEGTPLEKNEVSALVHKVFRSLQPVSVHTVLRTIATARIVLPKTIIRLAAGRHTFSETEQAMVSTPIALDVLTDYRPSWLARTPSSPVKGCSRPHVQVGTRTNRCSVDGD